MTADLSALQDRIISDAAKSHPSLVRGQVWCRSCGATRRVDSGHALRNGWPKCCDATMTIDSPEEQQALSKLDGYEAEGGVNQIKAEAQGEGHG